MIGTNVVLLISAAVLGVLGFFEPCTIATHTLFAARTSHSAERWRALGQLALSRTLLLMLLFGAAAKVGLTDMPPAVATTILFVMGAVYLLTIKVYLPVPHLEFYRLLPGGAQFPQGLKLGMTLPACTLPLIVILTLMSALTGRLLFAVLAGALFGAALLLAFALGRAVPIILGAWTVGWLENLNGLSRSQKAFEIAGGLLHILFLRVGAMPAAAAGAGMSSCRPD